VSTHWRIVCLSAALIGCGQPGQSPAPTISGDAASDESALPTASIASAPVDKTAPVAETEPEPGSPQWLLREIQRIRIAPLPGMPDGDAGASDTENAESVPSPEEMQQRLADTRTARRERNLQVVKLATEALALTAKDPQFEPEFLAAVGSLLDARLQLALQGDEESISALYDIAEAFHQKKPGTTAAAAAQLTLVNLAHAHTLRYGKTEPQWLQEFSRQAQLYVTRFPNEQQKSLPLLLAAGRTCELHGLSEEAKSCYGVILAKFPETQQARQCEGILRRLNLAGQPLQFAGPTLDGNFVSVDDYAGKSVVIVFWASHVKPFHDQVTALQAIGEKYKRYAQVLSVSLDSEESEIDAFLEESKLTWPVIFHVEPDKRGWNSPLASYYGISVLPTIWIVDPEGKVADTQVTVDNLETKLREVLLKYLNKDGSRTATEDNQARTTSNP